jgi:protease-4
MLTIHPMRFLPLLAATTLAVTAAEEPAAEVVAVYRLEGRVSESGRTEPTLLDLATDTQRPVTAFDLTRSLEKATVDPAVKAVVLDADFADLDLAQIQEIRRRLLAVRAAGKDVWLYSEEFGNKTALLGSVANHFTLMPEADCAFSGIHAESMYFKGLLDRLGVQADVIHIGDFKSFGENFYRTGPSDQAREQEEKLLDSVFDGLVRDVATGRKLPETKIRELIDRGALTAAEAKSAGLADETLYRTDFNKVLLLTYPEAEFDTAYAMPDADGPQVKGMMDLFRLLFNDGKQHNAKQDFVAVVALDGDITDESVAPVRAEILRLRKDDKAKGLVLRVNSPGGSALASEVLWEAADEWKATGKPFAVSMGGVAASGGYYVSAGADRIFAESGTITGSIGVVGMKFVIGGALEKLGITTHTTQRGKNAGVESMTRAYTPEEAALIRQSMTQVYSTFKKRVEDGRKERLKGELEPLAGGRVYSGEKAKDIGLVDEIGGLDEAIAWVAKAANLEGAEAKLLPEPKSAIEGLFVKDDPSDFDEDEILKAGVRSSATLKLRQTLRQSGIIEALPAPARAALERLASRMNAFQHSEILLLGPDVRIAP